MSILHIIGNAIREAREEKGWNKYRLSKESGVQINHIAMIEMGAQNATLLTLDKIAKALGMTIEAH